MSLVVEVLETTGQFEIVRADGYDAFQGFMFVRPMPVERLIEYLRERT